MSRRLVTESRHAPARGRVRTPGPVEEAIRCSQRTTGRGARGGQTLINVRGAAATRTASRPRRSRRLRPSASSARQAGSPRSRTRRSWLVGVEVASPFLPGGGHHRHVQVRNRGNRRRHVCVTTDKHLPPIPSRWMRHSRFAGREASARVRRRVLPRRVHDGRGEGTAHDGQVPTLEWRGEGLAASRWAARDVQVNAAAPSRETLPASRRLRTRVSSPGDGDGGATGATLGGGCSPQQVWPAGGIEFARRPGDVHVRRLPATSSGCRPYARPRAAGRRRNGGAQERPTVSIGSTESRSR